MPLQRQPRGHELSVTHPKIVSKIYQIFSFVDFRKIKLSKGY